ncbi:MAG TPA: hypothetical protein VFO34_12795 [Candidatus Acidoferrales bacterium]|nr:hypothetical protein [Candidatus Acidoferrales bacterium]
MKWSRVLFGLIVFSSPVCAQTSQTAPPPTQQQQQQSATAPAAQPQRFTLPSGFVINVRVADAVDTNHNHSGDLLTGIVDPSVLYNDRVIIPRGTEAHIRLVEDKKGGHVAGKAEVRLELVALVINGQQLGINSDTYKKKQGEIAGKAKAAGAPAANAGTDAAFAAGPTGAAAGPVIAIFSAPKVQLKPNSRIAFTLSDPFTFDVPHDASTPPSR